MHVEISVALNFVISYLYNKLPRRRVDLFGEELEIGLKEKFLGHWYPENPSKGSGYRCVKGSGDEIDPVFVAAAMKAGLDIMEVKSYIPEDLTMWIDPSEVSYKIGENGPVKVLYSERKDEDGIDNADNEVQAASRTFNPDAQTFTPEPRTFTSDALVFSPDVAAFCADSPQSFQTIDSLSSSLSNMSLSPSSPVPPETWNTATSPSSNLFSSAIPKSNMAPPSFLPSRPSNHNRQQFITAAMFAQTKFGSTKLKTQVKRPNRLSPTEFGNYFRQQQRSYVGPQRPRSLSPRDPRIEFLMDQQQRMLLQQQQQQTSPTLSYGSKFNPQQPSPTGIFQDVHFQQSSGLSTTNSSPHISPHLSPQSNGPAFQDLIHSNINPFPISMPGSIPRPNSFSYNGRPSGFPTLIGSTMKGGNPSAQKRSSQVGLSLLSPDNHNAFVDGLSVGSVGYSNNHHLLMAN